MAYVALSRLDPQIDDNYIEGVCPVWPRPGPAPTSNLPCSLLLVAILSQVTPEGKLDEFELPVSALSFRGALSFYESDPSKGEPRA